MSIENLVNMSIENPVNMSIENPVNMSIENPVNLARNPVNIAMAKLAGFSGYVDRKNVFPVDLIPVNLAVNRLVGPDNLCPVWDLNPGSPASRSDALTTGPLCYS